jgi:hypothetical protein
MKLVNSCECTTRFDRKYDNRQALYSLIFTRKYGGKGENQTELVQSTCYYNRRKKNIRWQHGFYCYNFFCDVPSSGHT